MSAIGGKPTAAPACWPMPGHRTVEELDHACDGVHPAQILNSLAEEAARWPDDGRADFRDRRRDRLLALKAEGWKQSAIACHLGISDTLVSRIIRQSRKHASGNNAEGQGVVHGGAS